MAIRIFRSMKRTAALGAGLSLFALAACTEVSARQEGLPRPPVANDAETEDAVPAVSDEGDRSAGGEGIGSAARTGAGSEEASGSSIADASDDEYAADARGAGGSWSDGIGIQAGLSWGYGSLGSGAAPPNSELDGRSVSTLGLKGYFNYDLREAMSSLPFRLTVGPIVELRYTLQLTDPLYRNVSNLRGFGYLAGLAFGADFPEKRLSLLASIDFLGTHFLQNRTPSLQESRFGSPIGFRLSGGYLLKRDLAFDLTFQHVAYSSSNIAPIPTVGHTTVSVGGRYFFDLR